MLITGASGFIGQHLVEEFTDYDIAVLGDLFDPQLDYYAEGWLPDIVIHLAAKSEVAHSFDNYLEVSKVNYLGTVGLAESHRRLNPNLKLFVMASTMETYGNQPTRYAYNEDTPQYPAAPYSVAKVACEKYLAYMEEAYGFPSVILRQTNTYGRHDNDFFIVERIISQMAHSDLCLLGTPKPWRNFLYIDDLVRLYRAVVEQLPVGETFVTGPDNALSIGALAEKIKGLMGWTGEIVWDTQPVRPGEVHYLNSNPSHVRNVLGWRPEVGLDEGLKLTIAKWV
jgi:nucleoside-diphosphate-sugar epimerase